MPPKKWGDNLNLKFVEAYKEKEFLWNPRDPLYKNKYARETGLQKLSDEMDLDDFGIAEVKAKIKSLRSTYNLEVDKQKKSEKSGSGPADVYVPTLKWFNMMKEVMSKGTLKRQTQRNLAPVNQTANNMDSELDYGGEESGSGATSLQPAEHMQDDCREDDDPQPQPPKKQYKPPSKMQQIASTARHLQQLTDSLNSTSTEATEWDIFGNLVAAHLKKLSPRRALEAEMRIHAVLTDCRMQDLMELAPVLSTHPGSSVHSTEGSVFSASGRDDSQQLDTIIYKTEI